MISWQDGRYLGRYEAAGFNSEGQMIEYAPNLARVHVHHKGSSWTQFHPLVL